MRLRGWQSAALARFNAAMGNFLVVATPGAGKTAFSLACADRMISTGAAESLIVVVPTDRLRTQWKGQCAGRYRDSHIATYAEVASNVDRLRAFTSSRRTLVVLDEVHHCDELGSWGTAILSAFQDAERRLLLSGTPWRTEGTPIPFVNYVDGWAQPDFSYSYQEAMRDGFVRPVTFLAMDGESDLPSGMVSMARRNETASVLASALDPAGPWLTAIIRRAHEDLASSRRLTPTAGGLLIAANQSAAMQCAVLVRAITGRSPTLVTSDTPGSRASLDSFAHSTEEWLIAVDMISEGVDIPRLVSLVYATNKRTNKYFIQAVGRVVRNSRQTHVPKAVVYMPALTELINYAKSIGDVTMYQLKDGTSEAPTPGGARISRAGIPVRIGEAVHHSTINIGDPVTARERRQAEDAAELLGIDVDTDILVRHARYVRWVDQKEAELRSQMYRSGDPISDEAPANVRAIRPRRSPDAPDPTIPSSSVLQDVRSIFSPDETALHNGTILDRLASLRPALYAGWQPVQLTGALKAAGVEAAGRQVKRDGVNRSGVYLADLFATTVADPQILIDVLQVWSGEETAWSQDLVALLADLHPRYVGWDAAMLGNELRRHGIEVKDRHRRIDGRGVTRKGVARADLEAALVARAG